MPRFHILPIVTALTSFLVLANSASALPPADGSKCNSNWVNNEAAMQCFIQGEDDQHAGVKHPHYVACTSAGEIFCCVDDDNGNQNCQVAEATTVSNGHSTIWVQGVLAAQRAHLQALGKKAPPKDNTTFSPTGQTVQH